MTTVLRSGVLAIALLTAAASTTMGAVPVELVESSDSGITLRFETSGVSIVESDAQGGGYFDVAIRGASSVGAEGTPALPVVSARVAVPDCDRMEFTVEATRSRTERGVRVTPSLTLVEAGEAEMAEYRYVEGDVYETPGLWPPRAASMFGPSWVGTQRVAVIEFHPCQTDPTEETLVIHGAVEVRLSFHGLATREPPRSDLPRRENLLRATLLNYESGKAWRALPPGRRGNPTGDYFTTSANWAKLTVREQGVYRLSYSDLEEADIDPAMIDPATIRILSGGGLPVPRDVTDPRPEWMEECTILVEGEDDGAFDPADGIVFYGLAVDGWADELGVDGLGEPYYENPFANDSIYWLTWETLGTPSGFSQEPLRMAESTPSAPSPFVMTRYRARGHFEGNVVEFQGRGDNWFWYEMKRSGPEERFFHEQLDRVVTDSTGLLRVQVRGNSSVSSVSPDHRAVFYLNNVEAMVGEWDAYAAFQGGADGLPINEGYNTLKVYVPRDAPGLEGDHILIDWFEIEYWRELWADTEQLHFGSSGRTGAIEFSMGGFVNRDVAVFGVDDKRTVRVIHGVETDGDLVVFRDDVADTASYVAASVDGYMSPAVIEKDAFGDLRSPTDADYIMIAYDGFYEEAVRLRGHRESADGGAFDVRLVRVSDVYDEFSWGMADPGAIRDYLKYTHDNSSLPPTHALLIGGTSSDYRQYLPSNTQAFVPTVYSGGVSHYPSESWFVEFSGTSWHSPALALGRLPARSAAEVRDMIDKIESYETRPGPGLWKNTVILIADDEFKADINDPSTWPCCEFFHTTQADSISRLILPAPLDRKKIYLMEYEHDGAGLMPLARNDVIDAWNEGALIVNYTGHGNKIQLAHEYVFLFDDVARLKNIDALPLFFAASCRLNWFDAGGSIGELLVKSRAGGAIGSIGSTRDSNASSNSTFNAWCYSYIFGGQTEETRPVMDVGTAFQAAFTEGGVVVNSNNTKFCLLGDPAVTLAAPEGGGLFLAEGLEPLRRRDTVTVEAQNQGSTAGQSGVAVIRVSDSADTSGYVHVYPDQSERLVRYSLPGRRIYEGPVSVVGGEMSASFVVSAFAREGSYGRMRAYYYGEGGEGAFSLDGVAVRDSVDAADASAPRIALEFDGGATSVLPGTKLFVSISDASGVNLVDNGPGNGIVVRFDTIPDATDLTGSFLYDLDSAEGGRIDLELPALDHGGNLVTVSATDNMRNPATQSLSFEVISATDFRIRDVASYPNPFPDGDSQGTHVLFQLPVSADVRIEFFTVGGRLIRVIEDIPGVSGANQVYWDGRDQEGDDLANGVYLYRISAVSDAYRGHRAEVIGRAVVMR